MKEARTEEGDEARTMEAGPNVAVAARMKALGIASLAELGRRMEAAGVASHPGVVAALVHGTAPARRRSGRWCDAALGLSETLGCLPDELFDAERQWHPQDGGADEEILRHEELSRREANQRSTSPELRYEDVEAAEAVSRVLASLTPREERVLRMRFGIGGVDEHTMDEVGVRLGFVTRERVRQIEAKALRKLKHPSRSRLLRGLLDGHLPEERYSRRTSPPDAPFFGRAWPRAAASLPPASIRKEWDPWADFEPFSDGRNGGPIYATTVWTSSLSCFLRQRRRRS